MEVCCDICGDVGVSEVLITCSQCKRNVEHVYCMRTLLEECIDDWHCEECEKAKQSSSCLLGDLTDVSKTKPSEVCIGGELRVESKKLSNASRGVAGNWEKMVPTGKTKYISVKEALALRSGEKNYFPSSSNTFHSKPSQHKHGVGRLDRAAIKPRTIPLSFSHQNLASESVRPPKYRRPGNVDIHVKQQQQSRKHTDEFRSGISIRPSEASKDTHKLKEQPSKVQLPVTRQLVKQSPVRSPSVNASHVAISGGDGHNNALDSEKYSQVPALDTLWKGSFTIQDPHVQAKANHLVEAHPPSRVRKKIYEFSKQMPEVLHFKLVPSRSFWNNLFDENIADNRDIALYFFPGVGERSEEDYIQLVESIDSMNFALREQIADVELLIFSSKLLPLNCQLEASMSLDDDEDPSASYCTISGWEGKYFLWGVFHRLKRDPITPLDTRVLEMSVQPSDDANHDHSQVGDCEDVDMDIDMIGGIDVGSVDMRVTEEARSLNCKGEEPRGDVALLLEPSLQITSAPRVDFAPTATIPSCNVKIERNDVIPPGFEELHRLRSQSSSSMVPDLIPPGFEDAYQLRIQTSSSPLDYVRSGR